MRLKILWALGFSLALSVAYSQPAKDKDKDVDCDEIIKQNNKLANEKKEWANRFDSLMLAIEKRGNYRRKNDYNTYNDYYKNLFNKERAARDSVESVNKTYGKNIDTIKRERDEIRNRFNSYVLKKAGELDLLKGELVQVKGELAVLKDELTDCINVRTKSVHFMGKDHVSGKEIIFIPFTGENPGDKILLTDSLAYSVERLMKLVSKYGVMVKIKLEGECSKHELKKMRKEVAFERAKKLHSYLLVNYPLEELTYESICGKKNPEYRKGISIQICTN